jgi:hypothetical protein
MDMILAKTVTFTVDEDVAGYIHDVLRDGADFARMLADTGSEDKAGFFLRIATELERVAKDTRDAVLVASAKLPAGSENGKLIV